jgi:hypothetical protein
MNMRISKMKNRTLVHETPEKTGAEGHHFTKETLRQKIEKEAYELYESRGRIHGLDLDDWLQAEKMVAEGGK